jgi:hypothetical protein
MKLVPPTSHPKMRQVVGHCAKPTCGLPIQKTEYRIVACAGYRGRHRMYHVACYVDAAGKPLLKTPQNMAL